MKMSSDFIVAGFLYDLPIESQIIRVEQTKSSFEVLMQ